jgi:hypothetical protein
VRRAALLAFVAFTVGCGSQTSGKATVWVTHDRGAVVVQTATVPAGLTAMQGLERAAKVSTRYGGRYVRSVDGTSEHGQSSWFYYVNGYLADRSAAEYKLRPGDVEWWDFRSWSDPAQDPVVVGAFPEPFLHGYDGNRRQAVVVSQDRVLGRRLARLVRGRLVTRPPSGANVLEVVAQARPLLAAKLARPQPGAPVRFVLDAGFARRLLAQPSLVLRKYAIP